MCDRGYFPVVYGDNAGWVSTELVQVEMRTEPAAAASFDQSKLLPDGMATLVESVNLRTGPGTDHDAIRVIDAGTEVEATGEISGAYEKVKLGSEEGWVRSVYVDRGPEPEGDEIAPGRDHGGGGGGWASAGDGWRGHGVPTPRSSCGQSRRESPTKLDCRSGRLQSHARRAIRATGSWKRQFGGKTGWVAGGYLRQADVPPGSPPDVPVLMYHSIQENGAEYQVTAAQLEEQLQWLSQNGYESVTSADLVAWMTYGDSAARQAGA